MKTKFFSMFYFLTLVFIFSSPASALVVNIAGIQVQYYDNGGTGQAIVMLHGNSDSALSYIHQISAEELEDYHVIAVDLPGFGGSNPARCISQYNFANSARFIRRFARRLHVENAVFVGWSMGGHFLLEAAPYMPHAKGFVIFGTPPLAGPEDLESGFLPNPTFNYGFMETLTREEQAQYVNSFFAPDFTGPIDTFLLDAARTDGRTRAALAEAAATSAISDEREIVASMPQPLAVIHGSEDQLVNFDYFATVDMPTLWRGEVQVIQGAGHAAQYEMPDSFNTLLLEFISEEIDD